MKKKLLHLLVLALCYSCASMRSEQDALHESIKESDFTQALSILANDKYKKEENRLLLLMEKAALSFRQDSFHESLNYTQKAHQVADELYTKSIREILLSSVLTEHSKSFYGKIFERSSIYQLEMMNYLKLYTNEKDSASKKRYILAAVSTAKAWDSFYQTIKKEGNKKRLVYDYRRIILSSIVLEEAGGSVNLNRARILMSELFKNKKEYFLYQYQFNEKYDQAFKDKKSFKSSPLYEQVSKFIDLKYAQLVKKTKPKRYKSFSKQIRNDVEKYSKHKLMIHFNGLMSRVRSKTISYNLNWLIKNTDNQAAKVAIAAIGIVALSNFARNNLSYRSYSYDSRHSYVYTHHSSLDLLSNIGFDVKVPYVDMINNNEEDDLLIVNGEKKQMSKLVDLDNHLRTHTQEQAKSTYKTFGIKLGIKYILAITAAYGTYKSLVKQNNPMASTIALAQYFLSSKSIALSQVLDNRHWVSLPSTISYSFVKPSNKTYQVQVGEKGSNTYQIPVSNGQKLFAL